MALVLRVFSGPLADRTRAYWPITILGYAMTAVCVPLLAVTPYVGAAGLALASVLILAERAGKAVRSPAKSALLAEVARQVGRGRGFGVHKFMDELGAFSGPLLVAAILSVGASMSVALGWLAVPGAAAMVLLFWLSGRTPTPAPADPDAPRVDLTRLASPERTRDMTAGTDPMTDWLDARLDEDDTAQRGFSLKPAPLTMLRQLVRLKPGGFDPATAMEN